MLYWPAVTNQASRDEELCHNWEAVKIAATEKDLVYEFDGLEVHVWTGRPEPGDPCGCGARRWK